jgi:hypothetical protein
MGESNLEEGYSIFVNDKRFPGKIFYSLVIALYNILRYFDEMNPSHINSPIRYNSLSSSISSEYFEEIVIDILLIEDNIDIDDIIGEYRIILS